ncbi:hypothetical protein HDU80_007406 [Chytriomyces hyalinus]|nr:hypothetical protein HDU80_007406 [Chytriomyces hyalinus]
MGRLLCSYKKNDEIQMEYLSITSDRYFKLDPLATNAVSLNKFSYYGRTYYRIASGNWVDYYLSAHWDNGLTVYDKWDSAAYFEHDGVIFKSVSFKTANHRLSLRKSNGFIYCYNDGGDGYHILNVTWEAE